MESKKKNINSDNNNQVYKEIQQDSSFKDKQWKNLNYIYEPFLEILKNKEITFTCSKCSTALFTNFEVTGLYIISLDSYALIVDPSKMKRILNLQKEEEILNEDSKLRQKDCLFYKGLCSDCKTLIGHFIFCCPFEKDYMSDRILIFMNKVDILVTENEQAYYVDFKDLILENIKDDLKQELNEMNDLAKETNKKFTDIHNNIEQSQEFLEIKNIIIGTDQYLEDIEKLADYAAYLETVLK